MWVDETGHLNNKRHIRQLQQNTPRQQQTIYYQQEGKWIRNVHEWWMHLEEDNMTRTGQQMASIAAAKHHLGTVSEKRHQLSNFKAMKANHRGKPEELKEGERTWFV